METKDRTQASYTLVDINEQTRIAFEKCKGTKEQKIERLKKERNIKKQLLKQYEHCNIAYIIRQEFKMIRQQLKELEDDLRRE